jgi:hypothetical protein
MIPFLYFLGVCTTKSARQYLSWAKIDLDAVGSWYFRVIGQVQAIANVFVYLVPVILGALIEASAGIDWTKNNMVVFLLYGVGGPNATWGIGIEQVLLAVWPVYTVIFTIEAARRSAIAEPLADYYSQRGETFMEMRPKILARLKQVGINGILPSRGAVATTAALILMVTIFLAGTEAFAVFLVDHTISGHL